MKKTFLLSVLLFGCGSQAEKLKNDIRTIKNAYKDYRTKYSVPDEIQPYVQLFINSAKETWDEDLVIDRLIVKFDEIYKYDSNGNEKITYGLCYYTASPPKILIDPRYWPNLKIQERAGLILHELGHCIHKRGHVKTRLSIMFIYMQSAKRFIDNEATMLHELHDPEFRKDIFHLTGMEGDCVTE